MNLPLVAGKALQVLRSNRGISHRPPSPLYIVRVITPIRHSHVVKVWTDKAHGLRSFAPLPHSELAMNGVWVLLADSHNKN